MIVTCPHCGRFVSTDERIVKTRIGWVPTLCVNGDGPLPLPDTEPVSNHPYWYCSIRDGTKSGLLTGPYASYEEAEANKLKAYRLANKANTWAHFYGFGIASSVESRKTVFGMGEDEPEPNPSRQLESERCVSSETCNSNQDRPGNVLCQVREGGQGVPVSVPSSTGERWVSGPA